MIIRITREDSGDYVEGRTNDDADINDTSDLIDGLLVAYGFHPNSVKEVRNDEEYFRAIDNKEN